VFAINGNKGNVYLFTTDGLFIATLFRDSRTASWNPQSFERGIPIGASRGSADTDDDPSHESALLTASARAPGPKREPSRHP